MAQTLNDFAKYGFSSQHPQRGLITPETMHRIAQDAALITEPNTAVPVELTAYFDPQVIDILTAPRNAREIFKEEKKGDWTSSYMKWRTNEIVGNTQPYSDYGQSGNANTNYNWNTREQYRFQTIINYGDLEVAMSSAAKIGLASDKQRAAAQIIEIDQNRFYCYGVRGMEIYGILNDPNLPDSISPLSTNDGVEWEGKSTVERYNDVLAVFQRIANQTQGIVSNADELVLAVSPQVNVYLGAATDFNVSVLDMLKKYFTNLRIVVLPQLAAGNNAKGETLYMVAPRIAGMPSGILGYGEKFRAGRIIPALSSFSQKMSATTYGGVVQVPAAIGSMVGI
ncbi:hypothetical protein LMG33818_000043 [Halomonadaceae bacterium LMG 33818]|uniref:hypothetical protein n=1 Tax=Cernens ardua TaxID=3402176 RepID=UPI003EDCAF2C